MPAMDFNNPETQNKIPGTYVEGSRNTAMFIMNKNDMEYVERSSFNRSPDKQHAASLEKYIKQRIFSGEIVDNLKLCVLQEDIMSTPPDQKVKLYVADGQHRDIARKTVQDRHPHCPDYRFLNHVKILETEEEMKEYVTELNKALPQSEENNKGRDGRQKFFAGLSSIVKDAGESMRRRCLRDIALNKQLEDGEPLNVVMRGMTPEEIKMELIILGRMYEPVFHEAKMPNNVKSKVIRQTRLYQLTAPADQWLRELAKQLRCDNNKVIIKRGRGSGGAKRQVTTDQKNIVSSGQQRASDVYAFDEGYE